MVSLYILQLYPVCKRYKIVNYVEATQIKASGQEGKGDLKTKISPTLLHSVGISNSNIQNTKQNLGKFEMKIL
jgi:hypothetical protein